MASSHRCVRSTGQREGGGGRNVNEEQARLERICRERLREGTTLYLAHARDETLDATTRGNALRTAVRIASSTEEWLPVAFALLAGDLSPELRKEVEELVPGGRAE